MFVVNFITIYFRCRSFNVSSFLPDYVAINNVLQIPRTMYVHCDEVKNKLVAL